MYSMPYFKEKDFAIIKSFMQANAFVVLCGADKSGKPVATHVPVLIEEKEDALYLQGHIMRQTDHHKIFAENPQVLAIFNGPHTYVSASWYSNQQQASTWNYITVHARGELRFLEQHELIRILEKTTAHFENNPASPSLVSHMPEEYVQRLSKGIIAFEIKVSAIDNVFKLSQNKDTKSFDTIVANLQQQDAPAIEIAAEMQKRKAQIFPS